MTTPRTDLPFLALDTNPAGVDLVGEVRALNEGGLEVPWAWGLVREALRPGQPDQVMLTFGVWGGVGVLEWMRGAGFFVPVMGTNVEWVTYRMAGLDEVDLPPGAEVPVGVVYAAVTEFLVTGGEQPMCVEWREAGSRLARYS